MHFRPIIFHDWGHPTVFEIDSWNFQLDLRFSETYQSFRSFRQLFFTVSKRGPKEKQTQKPMYNFGNFSAFFILYILKNYEKKTCLKELKFCEVSENPKSNICWKLQLSISQTVGCTHFCMVNISNYGSPFYYSGSKNDFLLIIISFDHDILLFWMQ